jgi:hypothetical protein
MTATVMLFFVAAIGFSACGGGGSPTIPPPTHATVARGTHRVQLTASDGTTTETQPLTLVVK